MLGALTHTRITWALSRTAPQVSGVTLGTPCVHGVLNTPHGNVRNNSSYILYHEI